MRIAFLTGLIASILCGFFHYAGLTGMVEAGGFLYYSPLFIFLGSVYFSIKRTSTVHYNGNVGWKDALKCGGLTGLLIAFGVWIGIFIAFTHTDVRGQVNALIENNATKEEIYKVLGNMNRQTMFDYSRNISLVYFLLTLPVAIGSTVVVRLFKVKK